MTRSISNEREHEMSDESTGFAPDPEAEIDLGLPQREEPRQMHPAPVTMTRGELMSVLDDIRSRVDTGDSFEGNLTYAIPEDESAPPDSFDVVAMYRVGNSQGQGGMRMLGDWSGVDEYAAPAPEKAAAAPLAEAGGYFAQISFFGRIEHTGYVTEVVLHGSQAAYHIDLPEKLWGGNPLAWREYAASAFFEKNPVTEESVRSAWEAERERAERWRRQQAEWARAEPRALPAGDEDDGDPEDEF